MQRALWRFFGLIALAVSGLLAACGGSCLGCGGDGNPGGGAEPPGGASPPPPPAVVTQTFAYVAARGLESVAIYRVGDDGGLASVGLVQAGERVGHVAIHPSNRFAYAVNRNDNNVSIYAIDPSTGGLGDRVDVATGISPRLIRIHPSGSFAYVTNFISETISIYGIDANSGALNPLGAMAVGAQPSGLMIDPTGQFVFVESAEGVRSYSIGAAGALSPNGTVPSAVALDDIALTPSGTFLYAAAADGTVSRHAISGTGEVGPGTVVATGAAGELSVYIEPSGRFAYVTSSGDNSVAAFGLHPLTGELTPAGTVNPGLDPRSVAMGPTGEYLYATSEDSGTISVYAVDQTTGALTARGAPLVADFLPGGIVIASFPR